MKSGENGLIGPGSNNYGATEKTVPAPVKIPTCGRMVHYFPFGEDGFNCEPVYVKMLPAIVVEASDLAVNMVVFGMNIHPSSQAKFSVMHKSSAFDAAGNQHSAYWDWPRLMS